MLFGESDDTGDTPYWLLGGSALYVGLGVLLVLILITQPNPRYQQHKPDINNKKAAPHDDENGSDMSDDDDNDESGIILPPLSAPASSGELSKKKKNKKEASSSSSTSFRTPPHASSAAAAAAVEAAENSSSAGHSRLTTTTSSQLSSQLSSPPQSSIEPRAPPSVPSTPRLHKKKSKSDIGASAASSSKSKKLAADHHSKKKQRRHSSAVGGEKKQEQRHRTMRHEEAPLPPSEQQQEQHDQDTPLAPDFPRPLRSWDLLSSATMRFRHGHFSGHSVQRLVQQERHAQQEWISVGGGDGASYYSGGSRGSYYSQPNPARGASSGGSMSQVANRVLDAQTIQGEAEFYRHRYEQRSAAVQQLRQGNREASPPQRRSSSSSHQHHGPPAGAAAQPQSPHQHPSPQTSFPARRFSLFQQRPPSGSGASVVSRTSSGRSRMPALSPDVVSPDDAADAFDPGVTLPETFQDDFYSQSSSQQQLLQTRQNRWWWWLCCCCCCCKGHFLDLLQPDVEVRRILWLAGPATLSAMAEPCFRLGLVAVISHFLDTPSMVAYVLVILFVRITTEELSGAIADAESSLLSQALGLGGDVGFHLAGRHVQLAVLMQVLLSIPVLLAWSIAMEPVVSWLVGGDDHGIASLAANYCQIVVIDYGLQGASRAFMVLFHMTGQAQTHVYEMQIDLIAAAVTIAAVALTAQLSQTDMTLTWIGWIQVLLGAIKVLTKVTLVLYQGLLEPYWAGLVNWVVDRGAVGAFLCTSFPLLLGSLMELREWELLVLFIRHWGGDEVATWALMAIVWEILQASTEGLGEAAAVRVSLVLQEHLPDLARLLSHKAVLWGLIQACTMTGLLLLFSRNLSVALVQECNLQFMFNDLVGMTAVANISLSLTQIYWSLLGAQGRFGVASSTILLSRWLLTMPLAAVYIFFDAKSVSFDLRAVASAVAVGYMTATLLLAWRLFQSDWKGFAEEAAVIHQLEGANEGDLLLPSDGEDEQEEDDDDFDFDDDSSDSSTGFG